jgi:hypothetical protein
MAMIVLSSPATSVTLDPIIQSSSGGGIAS